VSVLIKIEQLFFAILIFCYSDSADQQFFCLGNVYSERVMIGYLSGRFAGICVVGKLYVTDNLDPATESSGACQYGGTRSLFRISTDKVLMMNSSLKSQCVAEFLGTGLFLFFGASCLCAAKLAGASMGLWEICIVWGLGIALAVYLTSGISGAHLNPAVTIAFWVFANFEGKRVIPYIVAQVAGAFMGAAICFSLYYNLFTDYETLHHMVPGTPESLYLASIFSTYPHASISVWQAAWVEIVITSILMGLIMALTDDGNGVPKGPLAPLLIGLLIAVIGAATGPLTGFAMNPARDFGPKLFTFFAGWGSVAMTGARDVPYFLIPIVAPVIGACGGAAIYSFLIEKNLPKHAFDLDEEHSQQPLK
jgi:glycerol uptake facilitator protein